MSKRDDNEPDDAPSAAEVAAAARLRDALEEKGSADPDAVLATVLRAAWSPDPIEDSAHAALLDDAPRSPVEIAEAEELARTIGTSGEPSLVTALRVAHDPSEIEATEHAALVQAALRSAKTNLVPFARIRRAAVVVASTFAAAAALTLWLTASSETAVPLARSRSTESLFAEPFTEGTGSARIDRIAVARAADYRDNRFAQWGLR